MLSRSTSLPLFLSLALLAAAPGPAGDDRARTVTITVDPAIVKIDPGERKRVYIRAEGVPAEGLAAFQFELHYDPSVIDLVDPNAGYGVNAFAPLGGSPLCASIRHTLDCPDPPWMITAGGRQAYGANRGDPQNGRLTIAYGTAGDAPPIVGDGTLAVVEVVGKVRGRGRLQVAEAILADGSDPPNRYEFNVPSERPRADRPGRERPRSERKR